jgi:hypothetical protein
MSSSLYWKPVTKESNSLPNELKYALQKRNEGYIEGTTLDYSDISYLEGLRDASVKGSQELIDAIEQYEEVRIWEAN